MSYDKTVWKTGDVITAEKLNKNENATGVYVYYPNVSVSDEQEVNVEIYNDKDTLVSPDEVLNIVKNNALVLFSYHDIAFPVMYKQEDGVEAFEITGSFIDSDNIISFWLSYYSEDGQTGFEYSAKYYTLTEYSPT